MGMVQVTTDYTDKDFDSLKLRLQNLIRSVFPEWTDYNVSNFGNILLELYAFVGDVLGFYQDNQALQSRIVTATQRKALLGLVKLIGYEPATASAAQATLTISLATTPTGDVVFEEGEGILTDEVTDPIRYQLLSEVTIAAGASPAEATVTAENSESHSESYSNTGLANQEWTLSRTPYIDDSLVMTAGNGTYTQAENNSFIDSTSTDRHFTVTVDQNNKAAVRIGNGVNGAIPVGDVEFTYKTGGGTGGRVEAGKLKRFETTTRQDSLGNSVVASVTNALKSSGGTDRATVNQIKTLGPQSIRVINRTVSREDYEINALRLSWVARALMLTSNEDAGVLENNGILFVIPEGGDTLTTDQKAEVLEQVTETYPNTLTFEVAIQDVPYKDVNVYAAIYIFEGYDKASVAAQVRTNLEGFFRVTNDDGTPNETVDFGANVVDSTGASVNELAFSTVFNVVRDTEGVRKVGAAAADFTLNDERADVVLTSSEFPRLGTATLTDGDTGGSL